MQGERRYKVERERRIISGPLLEVDFFPVTQGGKKLPERAPKSRPSTKEQEKYNRSQATKKVIRLVNANFDNTDIFMHVTYAPENAPRSEARARKDITNYLRRVKRYRETRAKRVKERLKKQPEDKRLKQTLKKLRQPFKYFYVIEKSTYQRGSLKGKDSWHFHLFVTGMGEGDRDILESMWTEGKRVNAGRFQPERFGPEAAAVYISKDPQGTKRFSYSRNLDKPKTPPPKDGKITRKGVERLARERADDREYWEKRYKGYRFLHCFPRLNPYNGHWYVSVVMYKAGKAVPSWDFMDE